MHSSQIKRLVGATAVALALTPLVALAQSPQPGANVCATACRVDYENQLRTCAAANDKDACDQAAVAAYTTCLAVCPANK
jgi:hypothetical protein